LADVPDSVEAIAGDLGNFSDVLDAVKTTQPDVIYHMGGMLTAPSDADPAAGIQANALGTFHVLEAARQFDVPQVLFTSSLGVYGADITEDFIDDYTVERPCCFTAPLKHSRKTWAASTRENMGSTSEISGIPAS
jgi:UDP-glucose 4-epimerase